MIHQSIPLIPYLYRFLILFLILVLEDAPIWLNSPPNHYPDLIFLITPLILVKNWSRHCIHLLGFSIYSMLSDLSRRNPILAGLCHIIWTEKVDPWWVDMYVIEKVDCFESVTKQIEKNKGITDTLNISHPEYLYYLGKNQHALRISICTSVIKATKPINSPYNWKSSKNMKILTTAVTTAKISVDCP